MKSLELKFIILDKLGTQTLKNNSVIHKFLVADETACIFANFFDQQGEDLKLGDIMYLNGGYASLFNGQLILY